MAKFKLGEILKAQKLITDVELKTVISNQKQWGLSFGRAAVQAGFCTEKQILAALSAQLNIPSVDLDKIEIPSNCNGVVPQKLAEQHNAVPIALEGMRDEVMVLAMAAPASLVSQDAIRAVAGKQRLKVVLAHDEAVHRAIGRLYRGERMRRAVTGEHVVLDARARELDLTSDDTPGASGASGAKTEPGLPKHTPSAQKLDLLEHLKLSPTCRKVLQRAATGHKVSVDQAIAKVLEAWAQRQEAARL